MTRLEWASIQPKEGKRNLGARVPRWKSRDLRAPFLWGQASPPEAVDAGTIINNEFFILYFVGHGPAEELQSFAGDKVTLPRDAQSESEVANWERLLKFETALTYYLRALVHSEAYRVTGARKEPVVPEPADLESRHRSIFETLRRVALEHEKRSWPFAPASKKKTRVESAETEYVDPESRCRAIVESLQRPDLEHGERRRLILEAEVLPFRGQQAAALAPLLRQFIETYRESNDPADLVAVGSAIRNYVATATIGDAFEAAANLLNAQGRLPIPIALEVEVAKMVLRKLTANPPAERDQYTELALRLEKLVDDYAKPRFLAREKHGTVALNAVLGLVLTRSGRDAEVVERMRTLGVAWFQQLLARRAARLRTDLVARDSEAKLADIAQALGQLRELDSPILTS